MATFRQEIQQLIQDTMRESPLVLEAQVFGKQRDIESVQAGEEQIHKALVDWLHGLTLAIYRISEEVDKMRGTEPPEARG